MDEDPVEILVGLAERGEIDPWNIDIVEVTDRFLAELERRRELDLRISGRTLFYAATLLRIKSECLGEEDGTEHEPEYPESDGEGIDGGFEAGAFIDPVDWLEHEIRRRLDRRSMRQAPVTLYELIQLLKTAEKTERKRVRRTQERPVIIVDDVISIAHREDYRETASRLMKVLLTMESEGNVRISLNELTRRIGWSLVDVYLSILFLALDGRVDLCQEEFFSELYIVPELTSTVATKARL